MEALKKALAARLIENAGQAHNLWSVRLAFLLGVMATLESVMPELKAALPENWIPAVALLIAVARVLKQKEQ